MRLAYGKLFSINAAHETFAREQVLKLTPTRNCKVLLERIGARIRFTHGSCAVYIELDPSSSAPVTRSAIADDNLVFRFTLRGDETLQNITGTERYRPGREVFCMDNLSREIENGTSFLRDSIADNRLGAPVGLVGAQIYRHTLGTAAPTATLTLRDRFGVDQVVRTFVETEPMSTVSLDFGELDLTAGRYRLFDNQGSSKDLYFDKDLDADSPLAVLEVFSSTTQLAPGGAESVPLEYQFLNGRDVSEKDYGVTLPARLTTWAYVVRKRHANNTIQLNNLAIVGPVAFSRTISADDTEATFTSTAQVPLSESRQALELHNGGARVMALPNPKMTTPLSGDPILGALESRLFIYV